MAQQQNESINDIPNNNSNENSFNMNDVSAKNFQQNGSNIESTNNKNVSNNLCGNAMAPPPGSNTNMNDQQQQQQQQKGKSPQNAIVGHIGSGVGPNGNNNSGPPGMPPTHNEANMHHVMGPYGEPLRHPPMPPASHSHHHLGSIPPELRQPDEQQQLEHMYNPQQGQPYHSRYHDPNMPPVDMYSRYHPGGKPATMVAPNRPPQRYIQSQGPGPGASHHPPQQQHQQQHHHQQQPLPVPPQQSQQQQQPSPQTSAQQQQQAQPPQPNAPIGQTPTLNSLLQSHQSAAPPQSHHHRYPNSYEQQQQQQQQQQQMQQTPQQAPQQAQPQPMQPYGPQQSWTPPQQRPYSPQMGQTAYRAPLPPNTSNAPRIQSTYPSIGQTIGSYPPPPPPPQQQQQQQNQSGGQLGGATSMQYSPYPQRYPTPPGGVGGGGGGGSNVHRPPYPASHQYGVDQSRQPWPPTGPAAAQNAHAHSQQQHQQHPPSPQHHVTAQSPVHAPSPSPQPPQPANSPHQDSIGQNSNDSSSCNTTGVGTTPGTPNSMAMRPTPSPTGSSGSRSMSPAVGQTSITSRSSIDHPQNIPLGNSNSSHASMDAASVQQQQQQSRSPMIPTTPSPSGMIAAAQGNYPTPPSPHMHAAYKGSASSAMPNALAQQGMPPYGSQSQQFPPGNYSTRPQYPSNYGPAAAGGQTNAPLVPNQNQYGGRPLPNQGQFPATYQQGWGPASAQPNMNHIQGKNGPASNPGGSPRPLNHLKQHLLHKGGYGNQSPTSPQSFVNGPGMHQPMGPPQMQAPIGSHQGPPRIQGPGNMGPPFSPHHNSQAPPNMNTHHPDGCIPPDVISQDNGISSSGSSTSSQHPATSLITTGPDGTAIDEASQQSTISNASAASGDDPQCSTPKRKGDAYNQSHLTSSSGTPTMHDDFEMGSPTWPRTPASPVFNSHTEPSVHRSSKKSDSLCKLYDMDDNPDRRPWLDKLLSFMEDRRTPITACPTISKQPLDLYRLYVYVKERGGFVEVCKVTKSKTWKDIAGMLGIGASSSAAYTLRKHYTKNLLAFECHFDRGGIDPIPIIQQVEAGSKKKTTKPASAPSPDANHKGSSNSQDSFPPPGSSSTSMDSYNAYPAGYPPPNNASATSGGPNYNEPLQRSPSQANPQPSHTAGAQYQGQQGYNQYGPMEQQQYGPPQPQQPFQQPQQGQFPPPNRYPPYGDGPETNIPAPGATPNAGDNYRNYSGGSPAAYPPPPLQNQQQSLPQRPYNQQQPPTGSSATPSSAVATPSGPIAGTPPSQYPPAPPQQFDYRQQEQAPQSRRHPDFVKESQYSGPGAPYNQRPQIYPNWQNNASPSHYNRGQYPPAPQQWSGQRPPGPPVLGPPPQGAQWNEQHRYPPQNAQPPYQGNQPGQPPQWANMGPAPMSNAPNAIRPPQRGPMGGKNMHMPPPQQGVAGKPSVAGPPFSGGPPVKRDIVFPPDSIEAVTPLLYRRKRLSKSDIGATDMWRIFMCLQSGLLSESTWALDVLNILLFDDSAVQWFGLSHLPGLLTLLLDHFQKSLADMFENKYSERPAKPLKPIKHASDKTPATSDASGVADANEEDEDGLLNDSEDFVDLGQVTKLPNPNDRLVVLSSTTNYTLSSRKGLPVKIKEADDDIFVLDSKRSWDIESDVVYQLNASIGSDPWAYGHTEPQPYAHLISSFKGEFVNIPFARYIKSSDRKRKASTTTTKDTSFANDVSKNVDGDNDKTILNSPKTTSVEEKKEDERNEPNVLEVAVADDKTAAVVESKTNEETKPEPMETSTNEAKDSVDSDEQMSTPIKKENSPIMDSDCREVDMELEKIPNGPQSNEGATDDKNAKENVESKSEEVQQFDLKSTVQDPAETLKRRRVADFEDECYARDEASLYLISENQDTLARRCICISNILRNLTFVPGNEQVFANSETFLTILGKILLLYHKHPVRTQTIRNYDREDDTDFSDSCSSLQGEGEWWWDYLIQLRENMMVAIANIAGHMQLSKYEEFITRPCLDGLLHWAVCPSAHGQDPFPSCGPHSALSPQRLALEALCKICVTDANVDLVIATPPFSRLENLCSVLTRHLCRNEDQVLREFSVNLLHYLAAADSAMARTVAMQSPCISYLVAFIEQAEQTALGVANQHGINYLRENPDSMGTSLDMLRRTAGTLLHLARHPDNRPLFLQQEQRLLGLVMSHILDQQVALIISRVLFQVSRGTGPITFGETAASKNAKKSLTPAITAISTPSPSASSSFQPIATPAKESSIPVS